jgi:two-component system response regulator MprA
VLLVEDDYDTREAFAALIENVGLDAVAVTNGREAFEQLRGGLRPCVIVLDIAMPEMDGFAFRREQLKDPVLAAIPVTVVSGAGWAVEREARSLGLTVFLRKPIELDELLALFKDRCGMVG